MVIRVAPKRCTYSGRRRSMKIESVTLRELRMRLKAPFETSFGVTQDRRILLVEILADGVSGCGEITTLEDSFVQF